MYMELTSRVKTIFVLVDYLSYLEDIEESVDRATQHQKIL